jgi:hypothetical protein
MIICRLKLLILAIISICFVQQVYSKSPASDSSYHPYHVNYWVSGSICSVGLLLNVLGTPNTLHKDKISPDEINSLNKNLINSFDRWALKQDPSQRAVEESYSSYTVAGSILLPGFLLLDKQIRQDWSKVLMMYMETMTITNNIYEWTYLGPSFQNKYRPIVYYSNVSDDKRLNGNNRNSFYSGHNAVVAASSYFMAKVYCDFNPQIGNNKYFIYGAATIPPLILGYIRVKELNHFPSDVLVGLGVGALVGIIIPELHRFQDDNISLGVYSNHESTGLAVKWQPDFLK